MYHWIAIYKDGSTLAQHDDRRLPIEVSSEQIDRKNLERFILFNNTSGKIVIELYLEEGQRLIYRRRVAFNETSDKPIRVIHLVGWQQTVLSAVAGGVTTKYIQKNIQSIAYCFESGEVALGGRFREGHSILYPVIFTDGEKAQGLKGQDEAEGDGSGNNP